MSVLTMIEATEPLEPVDWDRTQTTQVWACLRPRTPGEPRLRKLSDDDVLAIRRAYERGERQEDIATRFDIHRSVVSRIGTGAMHATIGRKIA